MFGLPRTGQSSRVEPPLRGIDPAGVRPEGGGPGSPVPAPTRAIRLDDILAKVRAYAPDADLDLVKRAYVFGERAHSGQLRHSGEPYFTHPMAVADILADLQLDIDSIAVALMHDTVEDTGATLDEIGRYFGPDIAEMVDGVTKLSKLDYRSAEEHQAENFRKMILAMAKDIRVILVKLADRTHNMRTLEHMREVKQRRIAQETLDIYAPIANRLGIQSLKVELENLAFRYLHPEQYEKIAAALGSRQAEHERLIRQSREVLVQRLAPHHPGCAVSGRLKHLYSIYRKMLEKRLEVDDVSDLVAVRILVEDVASCYGALGVVHSLWPPISERFKDYIARPKATGYQSLHTTVIAEGGERIEVQIRTHEMHAFAEYGIAAHWRYKEGHLALTSEEIEKFTKLRQLLQWAEQIPDSREFLDTIKVDLFADEVYVYTPKGEVRWFPKGATPLDFAYSIHTDLGHRCVGAKVNGRMVNLAYSLESGETVQIQTSASQKPSRDWLKMSVTSRARQKIRQYLQAEEKEKARELGRGMLERELKRYDVSLGRVTKDGTLEKVAVDLKAGAVHDLFLKVGYGRMDPERVVQALVPDERRVPKEQVQEQEARGLQALIRNLQRKRTGSPVRIDGNDNMLVMFAKCCRPLPGDPVVGYISRGRGVVVHSSDCSQALQADPERRMDVEWAKNTDTLHPVQIRVVTLDQPGVLANLTHAIGKLKINISKADVRTTHDQRGIITFEVLVKDVAQLVIVQNSLEALKGVISVQRVRGGA